jgi:hypothetical protein
MSQPFAALIECLQPELDLLIIKFETDDEGRMVIVIEMVDYH